MTDYIFNGWVALLSTSIALVITIILIYYCIINKSWMLKYWITRKYLTDVGDEYDLEDPKNDETARAMKLAMEKQVESVDSESRTKGTELPGLDCDLPSNQFEILVDPTPLSQRYITRMIKSDSIFDMDTVPEEIIDDLLDFYYKQNADLNEPDAVQNHPKYLHLRVDRVESHQLNDPLTCPWRCFHCNQKSNLNIILDGVRYMCDILSQGDNLTTKSLHQQQIKAMQMIQTNPALCIQRTRAARKFLKMQPAYLSLNMNRINLPHQMNKTSIGSVELIPIFVFEKWAKGPIKKRVLKSYKSIYDLLVHSKCTYQNSFGINITVDIISQYKQLIHPWVCHDEIPWVKDASIPFDIPARGSELKEFCIQVKKESIEMRETKERRRGAAFSVDSDEEYDEDNDLSVGNDNVNFDLSSDEEEEIVKLDEDHPGSEIKFMASKWPYSGPNTVLLPIRIKFIPFVVVKTDLM